ncbi:MAG TPA: hypothetical protein VMH41_12590 [Mycobacteriales bacterium]|nr:hypothetical protein [Mycobacteriales bacterium]
MSGALSAKTAVRLSAAVRAATGIGLLSAPAPLERLIAPPGGEPPTAVARLLGARLLMQSLVEATLPLRIVVVSGGAVDVLHAASMVVIAVAEPRYRRVAVVSALVATTAAAISVRAVRARA